MGWLRLSTKRRRSAKTFKKWIQSYTIASDRKYRRFVARIFIVDETSTIRKRFEYDLQIKNSPSCPIMYCTNTICTFHMTYDQQYKVIFIQNFNYQSNLNVNLVVKLDIFHFSSLQLINDKRNCVQMKLL